MKLNVSSKREMEKWSVLYAQARCDKQAPACRKSKLRLRKMLDVK